MCFKCKILFNFEQQTYNTLKTNDMKNYIILATVLFSGIIFAQEVKPVLEPFGKKLKATYFFENGELEGVWVSYDEKGSKTSFGEYKKGVKTGKWFFWTQNKDNGFNNLSEVDYSNNRIASIKNWKQESIANVE